MDIEPALFDHFLVCFLRLKLLKDFIRDENHIWNLRNDIVEGKNLREQFSSVFPLSAFDSHQSLLDKGKQDFSDTFFLFDLHYPFGSNHFVDEIRMHDNDVRDGQHVADHDIECRIFIFELEHGVF